MVSQGLGCALLPELAVYSGLVPDELSVVRLPGLGVRQLVVRHRSTRTEPGPATRAVLDALLAQAQGIDYIFSTSVNGASVITVNLRLNYDATKALSEACARFGVVRLRVFGSVLTEHFDPQTSDSDFLVDFQAGRGGSICGFLRPAG